MPLDTMFQAASLIAPIGWIALLASPLSPVWADRIAGQAIPALLSVGYVGLMLAFWSRAEGGFGSLPDVMTLFENPAIALAGWVHYLAFDLMIGAWIARTARAEGVAFWLIIPCFALTLMFGPAGYLAFTALRVGSAARRAAKEA